MGIMTITGVSGLVGSAESGHDIALSRHGQVVAAFLFRRVKSKACDAIAKPLGTRHW
jgi:hypothetical protein